MQQAECRPLVLRLTPQLGNVNADAVVDVDDLLTVVLNWGVCNDPGYLCTGDTTLDGVVNVDDLIAVILNWTPPGP